MARLQLFGTSLILRHDWFFLARVFVFGTSLFFSARPFFLARLFFWAPLFFFRPSYPHAISQRNAKSDTFKENSFQFSGKNYLQIHGTAMGLKWSLKGEALRLLRTNSSRTTFEENIYNFKSRLLVRGYPKRLIETLLSDVKFTERESALRKKNENRKELLPLITQHQPSVLNLKNVLMEKWHLIQNQPSLRQIFKEPPLVSYKRGKSLKDIPVRAKTPKGSNITWYKSFHC